MNKIKAIFRVLKLFLVPDLSSGLYAYLRGMKAAIKEIIAITYSKIFGYYKHIDFLPIYNWFELMKGNYKYLHKFKIKLVPNFYERAFMDLFFQLDKINMQSFEDTQKLAYLRSLEVTGKTKAEKDKYKNKANFFEASINQKRAKGKKDIKLNDMVSFIEETFGNIGQINVHKISTSRFFNLHYRAIDKSKNK